MIDKNIDDIDVIINGLSEDKKSIGLLIYDELIFIKDTLDKLKDDINNNGVIEQFINGKQQFNRESKALLSYNRLVKTYNNLCKDLINLLPKKDNDASVIDDFDIDDLED